MKAIFSILLLTSFLNANAKTIERLNLFPDAKSFAAVKYEYRRTHIESPRRTLNTKDIHDFSNTLTLSYAYKFFEKAFIGITVPTESAVESGVRYGMPVSGKYTSTGFKQPEFFSYIKLREETEERGLIYLTLEGSPSIGISRTGKSDGNRLQGKNFLRTQIYHGSLEKPWEFQTALKYEYYGPGEEKNTFSGDRIKQSSYNDFLLSFSTQYEINEKYYILGSIGFIYRGNREMHVQGGEDREIQAGTGSRFQLAGKYVHDSKNLLVLSNEIERNDYFVKGDTGNFDGYATFYGVSLTYLRLF